MKCLKTAVPIITEVKEEQVNMKFKTLSEKNLKKLGRNL